MEFNYHGTIIMALAIIIIMWVWGVGSANSGMCHFNESTKGGGIFIYKIYLRRFLIQLRQISLSSQKD